METNTNDQNAAANQQAQLMALLAQQMQALGIPASTTVTPAAASGWGMPQTSNPMGAIEGISVPIAIETPAGKVRLYLHFPGSLAKSPEAIMSLVQALSNHVPLDIWQSKNNGWGRGGGNNNGGYGRGGNNNGWGR